jgi:DNA-binding winged helix-turn-helix (wHTH) protein
VLDLDRGCLLLDENEITLRPKTFAVLHFLIENCGRLVSKDELFAAVWPGIAVTDDALVQSIGELRRAFGDGPRVIRTVPRRGYRFESDVSPVGSTGQSSAGAAPASSDVVHPAEPAFARAPFTSLAPAHTGPRVWWFASFAFAFLVAAGMLWSGFATEWKFLNILRHASQSTTRSPEIVTKPVIAVLPFLNESEDSGREYFADD